MRTLGWCFAIFSFASLYRVQGATQFWLNEVVTETNSLGVVRGDLELVVWTEKEGSVSIKAEPYLPNGDWTAESTMEKQSADGPWKGFYVVVLDVDSADVFAPDGAHGGVLVTHDGATRMYCWGNGVTTNTELGGNKCQTIITSDSRGLNAGPGTEIAYGLYNSEDTPTGGGGKESDFKWVESKDDSNKHFATQKQVNTCPTGSSCTGITDQAFCTPGSGTCTAASSSGWRPTSSAIVSAVIALLMFC